MSHHYFDYSSLKFCLRPIDHPSILCFPDCEYHPLESRRLLLLCVLYCAYFGDEYYNDAY